MARMVTPLGTIGMCAYSMEENPDTGILKLFLGDNLGPRHGKY